MSEMFYFFCKVDRVLTGLNAQQKGTTAQWYSNKTSLTIYVSKWTNGRAFLLFEL